MLCRQHAKWPCEALLARFFMPLTRVSDSVVASPSFGMAKGKEGHLEAHGEKLLQELVSQEQNLVAKVEAAKAEAAKLIEEAQAEAQRIRAQAAEQAEQTRQAYGERAKAEAEQARKEVLKLAQADVDSLEARAQSNRAAALELVLERVLA